MSDEQRTHSERRPGRATGVAPTPPVVLVHGNPETAAVWDLLVASLIERGIDPPIRLSPPGFGAPADDDWSATAQAYRGWLIGELESIGRPVHLVGHDFGGRHVIGVAMTRPDLLRSWCSDTVGSWDVDYVWHDLAQRWQQPGVGEGDVATRLATPAPERAASMASRGMDRTIADRVAAGYDELMGACILRLYRSAIEPSEARFAADLELARARPGLAIVAADDDLVGTDAQKRRAAARAGAEVAVLDGVGHWWMTQAPDRGADLLVSFWNGLAD